MELSRSAPMNGRHPRSPGETNTRLTGRWLILARATWILFVAFAFVVVVASLPQLPAFLAHLQRACIGNACVNAKGQMATFRPVDGVSDFYCGHQCAGQHFSFMVETAGFIC